MTCIYNEGAAGTSLLDGHNVSIRVCVCVSGKVGLNIESRELEGESPLYTYPYIHPPHPNAGFFYLCLSYFIHSDTHTQTHTFTPSLWKKI